MAPPLIHQQMSHIETDTQTERCFNCRENWESAQHCHRHGTSANGKTGCISKPSSPTKLKSIDYAICICGKGLTRWFNSVVHCVSVVKVIWFSKAFQVVLQAPSLKHGIVALLLLVALMTVNFPLVPFDSTNHDFVGITQQSWNISSRRAVKMLEGDNTSKIISKLPKTLYGEIMRLPPYWEELTALIESLGITYPNGQIRLGLLNFKADLEPEMWAALTGGLDPFIIELDPPNSSLTWKHIFPEWIDEEEMYEVPKCPPLPLPDIGKDTVLDVVFVKLPCNQSEDWGRNVVRLQLQLAAAKVAAYANSTHVILLSECPPLPNVFTCKELVAQNGNLRMYTVNWIKLRKKLALPVGSCELAVPLKGNEAKREKIRTHPKPRREAYATILHSAEMYVCGAITLAQSIRATGSSRDMVILIDDTISAHDKEGLEEAGWTTVKIDRIRNPRAEPGSYNEWNYSKLRLWQLKAYRKLIFIDADAIILRNIDFLFEEAQELSASGNSRIVFNSGLMVVEPASCTFEYLMASINKIVSYNGGDQGFLNEIYPWWHRLPRRMNYLKHFYSNSQEEFEEKTKLFGMQPPALYVLHFLGIKPWLCFRDYDCNWHYEDQHTFASDVAHATWFRLHDSMPPSLQKFCSLSANQTAVIAYDMAAAASFFDTKTNISDPRYLYPT